MTLKSRTLRALSWSLLESAGVHGVKFLVGLVLARLLFPEDFGLLGMLLIFIALSQSFLDGGFGAALIQKRDVTATDISSIFYFNLFIGVLAAGVLCLAAPSIAAFYSQPLLIPLTRLLSLTIVINAFGLIHTCLLTKKTDFRTQSKASLISAASSGLLGIGLAIAGFGVWSLAAQQITAALLRTAALWILSPWRPDFLFSWTSLRRMFPFGSRMFASDILNQVFENVYFVAIGKLFSPVDLGLFTRAKALQELPSGMLSTVVQRVTFPVFAGIQDDRQRIRRGLRKALTYLMLINSPLMIGVAVTARPLVLVLLGERWAGAVIYLQLLCVVGLLFPLHVMNLNVLMALGRSDLFLKIEIIKKVLIIANVALTWRWGVTAIIWGMIATSLVSYYINSYYSGRLVGYSAGEQMRDVVPYVLMAVVMGLLVYAAGTRTSGCLSTLITQVGIGSSTYILLCRAFRLSAFMAAWRELLGLRFWTATSAA